MDLPLKAVAQAVDMPTGSEIVAGEIGIETSAAVGLFSVDARHPTAVRIKGTEKVGAYVSHGKPLGNHCGKTDMGRGHGHGIGFRSSKGITNGT